MEIQKAQGREERVEVEATGQKQNEERRQLILKDIEEESRAVAWRENLESHQENTKSWMEDLEGWQRTLGGGEEPLRKSVITAFCVGIVITFMLIVLVLYIRDVA